MQIIGGTHRGRKLQMAQGHAIRPTSARSREALFNILMHRHKENGTPLLQGARFADLCCGSGAVGLEALSRGARHVTFLDHADASLSLARTNAATLKETPHCEFIRSDVTKLPTASTSYDVLFADPPYASNMLPVLAEMLIEKGWLHSESVFITEQPKKEPAISHRALVMTDERIYGKAVIRMYQF